MTETVAPRRQTDGFAITGLNRGNVWAISSVHVFAAVAVAYICLIGVDALAVWVTAISLVFGQLSVTVLYHRCLTHRSFQMAKWLQFFWSLGANGTLQGPPISWVGTHHDHHAATDTQGDPHTPYRFAHARLREESGQAWDWLRHPWLHEYAHDSADGPVYMTLRELWEGFKWAHTLWLCYTTDRRPYKKPTYLYGEQVMQNGRPLRDEKNEIVYKGSMYTWQTDHYWVFVVGTFAVPALVAGILSAERGWSAVLLEVVAAALLAALRVTVGWHTTWLTNSLVHLVGDRTTDSLGRKFSGDNSRNIWWLFALLLGENWHNLHHLFQWAYGHGHRWYHLDFTKWVIWLMAIPEFLRQGFDWLAQRAWLPRPLQFGCRVAEWVLKRCRLVWNLRRAPVDFALRPDQMSPQDRELATGL